MFLSSHQCKVYRVNECICYLHAQTLFSNIIPHKKNQDSSEKWLILGLRKRKYKRNLEYLVIEYAGNFRH
uniref:Uncharacterized protein n=1 Tax=Moschus moschiferus TaxID=68415 RepID=A0A8C6DF64_MOSMO